MVFLTIKPAEFMFPRAVLTDSRPRHRAGGMAAETGWAPRPLAPWTPGPATARSEHAGTAVHADEDAAILCQRHSSSRKLLTSTERKETRVLTSVQAGLMSGTSRPRRVTAVKGTCQSPAGPAARSFLRVLVGSTRLHRSKRKTALSTQRTEGQRKKNILDSYTTVTSVAR